MTSLALFRKVETQLSVLYPPPENAEIAFWLIEFYTKLNKTAIFVDKQLPVFDEKAFENSLKRLLAFEPIQYVLAEAYFFGRKFKVNSNVLIPRPETELLVEMIVADHKNAENLQILDIGTGSGCIAISLALEMPQHTFTAWDISSEALKVAKENAEILQKKVVFEEKNILAYPMIDQKFDVIVSNPPYVVEFEKAEMRKNVLDYEPHLALFVPDHDPFLFHGAILAFAANHLVDGGKIYLEINERYGENFQEILEDSGYQDIRLEKDWAGKDRFLVGRKKSLFSF